MKIFKNNATFVKINFHWNSIKFDINILYFILLRKIKA